MMGKGECAVVSEPHISDVYEQVGFVMVVSHMGNDVYRLESAQLVPRVDALTAKDLLDRTPLPYPMPDYLWDLVQQGVRSMGYDISGTQQWRADGMARAISDTAIEVLIWRKNDD